MRARLKVFGGLVMNGTKQRRTIIAATSRAKAAEAVHETVGSIRGWWSETGNATELAVALESPGQVFMASDSMSKDFRPVVYSRGVWIDA